MEVLRIQAADDLLTPEEILELVGKKKIKELRRRHNDPRPFLKGFTLMKEGESELAVLGADGAKKKRRVYWPREAIENSFRKLPDRLTFWKRHNKDNSTEGRPLYGEVVKKLTKDIEGKLAAMIIGYFPPGEERETAEEADIVSFEGDVNFKDFTRNVAAGVKRFAGIALGNSRSERPGFKDAVALASVQAFIYADKDELNEREKAEPKRDTEKTRMAFDPQNMDFKELAEIMDYRTLKKLINYRRMFPRDLWSPEDITGELTYNEETGAFGWIGESADYELQKHIMKNILGPVMKRVEKLQTSLTESQGQLKEANRTIFATSAQPLLEKIAEKEGLDEVVLKLATRNLKSLDIPERAKDMSESAWEESRDKALKRHLENALSEKKHLEELGAVFGETSEQSGREPDRSEARRTGPSFGQPAGEGNENPLVQYAKQ